MFIFDSLSLPDGCPYGAAGQAFARKSSARFPLKNERLYCILIVLWRRVFPFAQAGLNSSLYRPHAYKYRGGIHRDR